MIRHTLTFLCGAATSAAAAYLAGGGMRAGILIGAGLVVGILVAWPRELARVLLAIAEGMAAVRSTWKRTPSPLARPGDDRQLKLTKRPPSNIFDGPALTPLQADVQSALVNLGMGQKRARLAASSATAEDFEAAFRQAQAAA
jgi:hypothetical protein